MMGYANSIVPCWLSDDLAFSHIQAACASLKLHAVRMPASTNPGAQPPRGVCLLVCDLDASRPGAALDFVRGVQIRHPSRPVLIYFKPTYLAARLVSRLGPLSMVTTWAQMPGSPHESMMLARLISGLVAHTPALLLRTLTRVLLHQAPGDAPGRFVEILIARLEAADAGAPAVGKLAEIASLEPWRLRRECRKACLPNPERLSEYLTFIYVLEVARLEGSGVAGAARKVGVTETYLRHLRARLVPEVPSLRSHLISNALTQAIMRLGEQCGLSRQQASDVVGRIVVGG